MASLRSASVTGLLPALILLACLTGSMQPAWAQCAGLPDCVYQTIWLPNAYLVPPRGARMTLILRGRRWGFSLEEIRQWLLIYEEQGTDAQYREFLRLADRQLDALSKERAALDETIEDLKKIRSEVENSLA